MTDKKQLVFSTKWHLLVISILVVSFLFDGHREVFSADLEASTTYDQNRDAMKDIRAAALRAKVGGRFVLVTLCNKRYGLCRRFEKFLRREDSIRELMGGVFELERVWIDPKKPNEFLWFKALGESPRFPYFLVFDSDLVLLEKKAGFDFLDGRRYLSAERFDAHEFKQFIDEWAVKLPDVKENEVSME